MIICPDCKTPNLDESQFCVVCGGELAGSRLNARARILFFATPPVLVLIGMAFGLDINGTGSEDLGTGMGLFLAMLFMAAGGGYWLLSNWLRRPLVPIAPWVAGIYGVLAFVAAWLLSYPISALVDNSGMNRLPIGSEERFQAGLIFVCYLPMILIGLASLAQRDWAEVHRQPPTRFARLGATVTLFGGLILFTLLNFTLPAWESCLVGARLFSDLGRFQQAVGYLERSLAAKPDFPKALALKGTLLLSSLGGRDSGEALRLLRDAVKYDPRNPRYRLILSIAEERSGNRDEALTNASKAIDLNPSDPLLMAHFGDLLLAAKRPEEAIEFYRKTLRLRPDDPRILNNLAFTLIELNKDLPAALDLARESVQRWPETAFNRDTLAWAYYKNGQLNEAFETIRSVRAISSGSAEIEFHYAVIASELGLLNRPEAVFSALLIHPDVRSDQRLREQILAALATAPLLTTGTAILQGKDVGLGFGPTLASPAEVVSSGSRIEIRGVPVLVTGTGEGIGTTLPPTAETASETSSRSWGE